MAANISWVFSLHLQACVTHDQSLSTCCSLVRPLGQETAARYYQRSLTISSSFSKYWQWMQESIESQYLSREGSFIGFLVISCFLAADESRKEKENILRLPGSRVSHRNPSVSWVCWRIKREIQYETDPETEDHGFQKAYLLPCGIHCWLERHFHKRFEEFLKLE